MRQPKNLFILLSFILLFLTAGCWDRKEIENVGIVLGLGIDKPIAEPKKERKEKTGVSKASKQNRIAMIHSIAIPKAFAAKEAGKVKNFSNVVNDGDVIFENIREMSTRTSRSPSYEHLKVIVISEDIARSIDLREIINFLMRNPETRRSIKVLISKGKSRDVYEPNPPIEGNPALKLNEMAEHTTKTLRMTPLITMGDMSEYLTAEMSFVVQRVISTKKETKIAGAAVVKGKSGKMIGWLGEEEAEGLNWLKGGKKISGLVKTRDQESGKWVVYETLGMESKIIPRIEGNKVSFTVKIETEGKLREDWMNPGNAFEESFVQKQERNIEKRIKEMAEQTINKTQKVFKVDVIGFGKKLRIASPQLWKKWKDNWEERFTIIPVNIQVKVKIREYGTRGTKSG